MNIEEKSMNINGFIMQKREERFYQGIEGDNWYLNYNNIKWLDNFFEENIEKAWENTNYVDVCNDIEYIQRYVDISKERNIEYRVLACIAEKELPQMELSMEKNMVFLGYDYAYSGGSYYSAVLNEILTKRIPSFSQISLNSYGLFETYEQIVYFINQRKAIKGKECTQKEYLEEGDFTVFKLYELRI